MPAARVGMAATVLDDGRVLLLGGMDAAGNPTTTSWLFDPSDNSFTVAGGTGDLTNPVILATSEIYNPATGSWSAGPSLSASRFWPGFAALPDGTYLFVGGFSGLAAAAIETAEVYQP